LAVEVLSTQLNFLYNTHVEFYRSSCQLFITKAISKQQNIKLTETVFPPALTFNNTYLHL